MPQPLSEVRSKGKLGNIIVAPGALYARPALALGAMRVINTWSHADVHLTGLLARVLNADSRTITEMLLAITSAEAKRAAIMAGVVNALGDDEEGIRLFQAVMKVTKPSRDRRNEYAHHVWAVETSLDDAILLIDPRLINRLFYGIDEYMRKSEYLRDTIPDLETLNKKADELRAEHPTELDRSKIMVYRAGDIERDGRDAGDACSFYSALSVAFLPDHGMGPHDVRSKARSRLFETPQIQQALQPKSNESVKEAPPRESSETPAKQE